MLDPTSAFMHCEKSRGVTHILAPVELMQALQKTQAAEQVGFLPEEELGLGALKWLSEY